MNEWLTTGKMIDSLKDGQIAENRKNLQVIIIKNELVYASNHNPVHLSRNFMNAVWRILPEYVSFEEAVEAYRQGKTVCLYDGERKSRFQRDITEECFTLMNMVYSKWTIEE